MKKITLPIHNYLPQISSPNDQSIIRLIGSLKKRKGFNRIELLNDPAKPLTLAIEHDNMISSNQITQITETIADRLTDVFGHLLVKVAKIYQDYTDKQFTVPFEGCPGVTHILSKPHGWIDLEFNRYMTAEAQLVQCINQRK